MPMCFGSRLKLFITVSCVCRPRAALLPLARPGDAAHGLPLSDPVHGRPDLRSDVAGPDHCFPAAKLAAVLRVVVPPGLLRHGTNPATRRLQGAPKPSSGFGK